MTKICYYCKKEHELSYFSRCGKQPSGKTKYKPYCKDCETKVVRTKKLEILQKAYKLTHNDNPFQCEVCGYNKNFAALHFHHIDPQTKELKINQTNISLKTAINEIAKCILLCSNCHMELHHPECVLD